MRTPFDKCWREFRHSPLTGKAVCCIVSAHDFSRGLRDQMTPRRTVSTVSHYPTAISRLLYRLDPFPAHDFSRGLIDQMTPRQIVSTVSYYPTAIIRWRRGVWPYALPVLPPLFLSLDPASGGERGRHASVGGEFSPFSPEFTPRL